MKHAIVYLTSKLEADLKKKIQVWFVPLVLQLFPILVASIVAKKSIKAPQMYEHIMQCFDQGCM